MRTFPRSLGIYHPQKQIYNLNHDRSPLFRFSQCYIVFLGVYTVVYRFIFSDRKDYFNKDFHCIKTSTKFENHDKKLFKNKIFQWFQCFFSEAAWKCKSPQQKTKLLNTDDEGRRGRSLLAGDDDPMIVPRWCWRVECWVTMCIGSTPQSQSPLGLLHF